MSIQTRACADFGAIGKHVFERRKKYKIIQNLIQNAARVHYDGALGAHFWPGESKVTPRARPFVMIKKGTGVIGVGFSHALGRWPGELNYFLFRAGADCWIPGRYILSCHAGLPFEEFTRGGLSSLRNPRAPAQRRVQLHADEIVALKKQYPWLTDDDFLKARANRGELKKAGGGGGGGGGGGYGDVETDSDLEEIDGVPIDEVNGHLKLLRADEEPPDYDDSAFYVRKFMGGKWLVKHKGKITDSCGAFARGGDVKDVFCWNYTYPRQMVLTYAKYDGLDATHTLCREFCLRGNYFFNLWVNQDEEIRPFTDEEINGYADSEEFLNLLTSVPVDSDVFIKGTEIRKIIPQPPLAAD